jgi:hypothetical protein
MLRHHRKSGNRLSFPSNPIQSNQGQAKASQLRAIYRGLQRDYFFGRYFFSIDATITKFGSTISFRWILATFDSSS